MTVPNATRFVFCAALTLAVNACALGSRPTVTPAPLRYALPQTTLIIELQVERASDSPGKYCDFLDLFYPELDLVAACQTGDAPAPGANRIASKMRTTIQGYAVSLKGRPDPSRMHDMSFDASWHVDTSHSLSFTESGMLSGAEIQRTDRTLDIVLGFAAQGATLAGRMLFGDAGEGKIDEPTGNAPWDLVSGIKQNFALLDGTRQAQYQALWAQAGAGKARLALATRSYENTLGDIKALSAVLSGAAGQGTQALIPEVRKQIADRLAADFVGAKSKDTWKPVYEFTPPAPGVLTLSYQLFRFSACGVLSEFAIPVKETLAALRCGNSYNMQESDVAFTVKTTSGVAPSRVTTPDTAAPSNAVLYHVRPEPVLLDIEGVCRADVTVMDTKPPSPINPNTRACNMVDQPSLLAQWGVQGALPPAGRDWAYNVTLYEATGAVKTVKLTTKALLDKASIDSAFGAVTSILDAKDTADAEAKKKADEAAATAAAKADELAVLARERQILEEKAKIKKLCDELGLVGCES